MGIVGFVIGLYLLITVLLFSFFFYEDNKEVIRKRPVLSFIVFTLGWPVAFTCGVIKGFKEYKKNKEKQK